MKRFRRVFLRVAGLSLLAVIIAACATEAGPGAAGAGAATDGPAPLEADPDILYVNLTWHQHQPLYFKDPDTGVYTRPWVRVHATKSYYDMAALLAEYPDVRATFNLTPVLLRQLEDFENGAKDIYWVLAEKPVSQLTQDDKRFILERFFDANYTNIIGRYPRYNELLQKRGGASGPEIARALETFTEADFRDLQIWFNLAWFDPSHLAQEPLASLVAKGRNFAEADKAVVFAEALRIISQVVPIHRELQDRGQIEVTTTPYAHPILPLIYNTDLAANGDPSAELPDRFSYPNDAIAHLARSVEIYEAKYGRAPRGLWPAEGSVGEDIVRIVHDAGFGWMASGEHVLARSLGLDGFTRDGRDVVNEADALYRPYYVEAGEGERVAIVFRDLRLSDLIGFEYSQVDPEQAARDLITRISHVRERLEEQGAEGPHLVSIILDGENAWEHYPNDGIEFLNALYRNLSETEWLQTTTVSEYLELFPEQRDIETLHWGSWFSPDYATWIGEPEETEAWNYLGRVRRHLAQYDIAGRRETTPERLAAALDSMYLAEGSDWFWWYGADQDSGVDEYFDLAFRSLLKEVYLALGDEVPDFLDVPIIPARPASPVRGVQAVVTPTIDGRTSGAEWDQAGYVREVGGVQARGADYVEGVAYGFDASNLYFRIDTRLPLSAVDADRLELYISLPGQEFSSPFTRSRSVVGFQAGFLLSISADEGAVFYEVDRLGRYIEQDVLQSVAFGERGVEVALPLSLLPETQPGDFVKGRLFLPRDDVDVAFAPVAGPFQMVLPELGSSIEVLAVADPPGDDHGPGTFTYPTDGVFVDGSYDLTTFAVSHNERNMIFRLAVDAPIANPWGSGINLSVQTFDIYIDVDPGAGTGARMFLEGRNAALPEGSGWDYAIWVEGWNQQVLVPDDNNRPVALSGSNVRVVVNPESGEVSVIVPKAVLADIGAPEDAAYTAAVMSQDGFPAPGVRRIRGVAETGAQWVIGGGSGAVNQTRIMDLAWPIGATPTQEEFLSDIPAFDGGAADLRADDLAIVPLNIPR